MDVVNSVVCTNIGNEMDRVILIPVLIAAVQNLVCLPDAKDVFFRWATQEGRRHLLNADLAAVTSRSLQPWKKRILGTLDYGLWLNRLLLDS